MKPSSLENPPVIISRVKARNCALLNQLATPGLGSLLGGRIVAGGGQLALAIIGFGLLLVWFFQVMSGFYGMITDQQAEPQFHGAWGLAGAVIFVASWCWSGVTSISLMREAGRGGKS